MRETDFIGILSNLTAIKIRGTYLSGGKISCINQHSTVIFQTSAFCLTSSWVQPVWSFRKVLLIQSQPIGLKLASARRVMSDNIVKLAPLDLNVQLNTVARWLNAFRALVTTTPTLVTLSLAFVFADTILLEIIVNIVLEATMEMRWTVRRTLVSNATVPREALACYSTMETRFAQNVPLVTLDESKFLDVTFKLQRLKI